MGLTNNTLEPRKYIDKISFVGFRLTRLRDYRQIHHAYEKEQAKGVLQPTHWQQRESPD